MKKSLSLILTAVMLLSSVLAPSCAFALKDDEAPIIWTQTVDISITNDKDIAEAGDIVNITVAATDNVAIESFLILVESPSGNNNMVKSLTKIGSTDYYTVDIPVTSDTEAGYWSMTQMQVTDPSGNFMYISNLTTFTYGVSGDISECDVSFKDGETYAYSPSGVKPELVVKHNGVTLKKGTDYKVKYENNGAVGTATATVTGIGCFSGTQKKEFTIIPQTRFRVKLSTNTYIYNGKVKRPAVTVYDGDSVVDTSNYTVKYTDGRKNVGKYPITVTMKNNYSGEKVAHIVIKPQGTSLSTLTAKKNSITAVWKKQSVQTTGYQLQYSTDSKFKKNVKSKIVAKGKTKATVKSLKKGKKYYFRIRTYTKTGGRTYYSKWSKVKKNNGQIARYFFILNFCEELIQQSVELCCLLSRETYTLQHFIGNVNGAVSEGESLVGNRYNQVALVVL